MPTFVRNMSMMRKERIKAQTELLEPVPSNITSGIVFSQQMPSMEYPT